MRSTVKHRTDASPAVDGAILQKHAKCVSAVTFHSTQTVYQERYLRKILGRTYDKIIIIFARNI